MNAPAHHAYRLRNSTLLLGVFGVTNQAGVAELEEDALRSIAEQMSARSR